MIPFAKYSGCGNDFILIDNRQQTFSPADRPLIKKLCQRRLGIGADGMIFLENGTRGGDFRMRIINADGSEAEMCGNGIRCLGKFIRQLGVPQNAFSVEVPGRLCHVQLENGDVSVSLGPPTQVQWSLQLPLQHRCFTVDYLNTGVPHAVIFTADVNTVDLAAIGPAIRYHPKLAPAGTNVTIASLSRQREIHLRTYERGVEGETLACGTGAAAAAIAAARKYGLSNPIVVNTHSRETLIFNLTWHQRVVQDVKMKGPATLVYRGEAAIA
ncbi:MAG: diaminopimelate epimerase [Waddliaceae bacterium]